MTDTKIEKFKESESDRQPINFYVSSATIETIDDALFYVKKRLPLEKRKKLSKSIFCEACLRIVLDEYNSKGEGSSLWKAIQELMQE
jgi:hypothetical protein